MAQLIQLKRSNTANKVPLLTDLSEGELAMNTADGKIYFKSGSNIIEVITAYSEISQSVYLAISSSENVGIGTTTPGTKLEVIGDISASGTIHANNFKSSGGDTAGISFTDDLNLTGHLTASGNISASGAIHGNKVFDSELTSGRVTLAGGGGRLSDDADLTFSNETLTVTKIANIDTTHITASGNISSSGNIIAAKVNINGGNDASLTDGTGYLVLGDEQSANIVIDNNEIIARNNEAKSYLNIQHNGGDVRIHNGQDGTEFIINDSGHVTSSGNISASGNLRSFEVYSYGRVYSNGRVGVYNTATDNYMANSTHPTTISGTNITLGAPVTASGNISASGIIYTNQVNSSLNTLALDSDDLYHKGVSFRTDGHITASGNISSSGTITAATADINGGTIDGATIATSDVTVGADKTLNVSAGTLTTSAAQKQAIVAGADGAAIDNCIIGANTAAAATFTSITSTTSVGIPFVIGKESGYLGSFSDGEYYYGNNSYGWNHHQFTNKISSNPDGETWNTQIGSARQHNAQIVPVACKNITLLGEADVATKNNTVEILIYKTTRQAGNSTVPTTTQIGNTSTTLANAARYYNIDITTTETVAAGDKILVIVRPGGTSGQVRWNYTLFGYTNG